MITYAKIGGYQAFIIILLAITIGNACRISEFSCRGSTLCLPLDKYCDGRDDCGDASDEPKHCTGKCCAFIHTHLTCVLVCVSVVHIKETFYMILFGKKIYFYYYFI